MTAGQNNHCRQAGFTLLEILVALTVMVIAMTALWKGLSQGIAVGQGLSDRVLARWVAQNRIVLRQVMNEWPDARSYSGTELMAGRTWYWKEQVATTGQEQLRSITVSVGTDEDTTLVSLQGLLHRPVSGPLSIQLNTGERGSG